MNRSRLAAAAVAVLLFGALFSGPAAAVGSQPQDIPEESEVGTELEATFEVTELFDEFNEWTLVAGTELENATWTVRQYNQAGDQISREDTDGPEATQSVDIDDGTATIEVRVTGTTPEIESYSYDPEDRFVVANFTQQRSGGTDAAVGSHETHHFTAESREAREAVDSAREAVEGSGSAEAERLLGNAVSAYERGNFENAIDLAEQAEGEASQSQLVRTGLLVGGAVVVVVVLAAGGYRLYRSRQQGPGRLK
ncbi:hypothetical protein [Natronomonas sp.]|uniref:hypothetical protein n=1 Tax=Natronomonas sp. TaxID=2184060 RepID=UPI002607D3B7|nr:hypothetical protein [Natronomonas sp.]